MDAVRYFTGHITQLNLFSLQTMFSQVVHGLLRSRSMCSNRYCAHPSAEY